MQNQLNELKRKMLEFFQRVKSKINHKKSEKVSEEKKSDGTGGKVLAILGSILVAIKGILNTLFILGFIGGLFGAGVALGYGVALFDKVKVPKVARITAFGTTPLCSRKCSSSVATIAFLRLSDISSDETEVRSRSLSIEAMTLPSA